MSYIIIAIIRLYQICISPYMRPCCRYVPTCSSYAITAVNNYGIIRGLFLALRRLLRCHPLAGHGYDPVPDMRDMVNKDTTKQIETNK